MTKPGFTLKSLPWHLVAIVLFGLLAVAGGIYWLSQQLEWKEVTDYKGYSDAARRDPFLAANHFLARQAVQTRSIRSFTPLDQLSWQGEAIGPQDTLILIHNYKMLQGQRLQKVLEWVEAGGTLILSTSNPFMGSQGSPDPLLESLGVARHREDPVDDFIYDADEDDEDYDEDYDDEDSSDEEDYSDDEDYEYRYEESTHEDSADTDASTQDSATSKPATAAQASTTDEATVDEDEDPLEASRPYRCNIYDDHVSLVLRGEAEPLTLDYSAAWAFDFFGEEPRFWAGNDEGVHLAMFERGQGRILVNSDNEIWENKRIDCHDHAYLLWKLVNPQGKVWFLINQESPSLWVKLWQATPLGASAALLALFFWLWAKSRRFGPILTREQTGRRSLAEHFHASAQLLWRRQQHPYLVTLMRQQLLREIQQHLPNFDTWKRGEQLTHLAQLSGLPQDHIDKALFNLDLQNPQDFTQAVACLQTLRKHL